MFRTLRSKLILSHVSVILFAFLLTVLIATIPILRAQEREVNSELKSNAESLARQLDLGVQIGSTFGSESTFDLAQVAQLAVNNEEQRSGNRVLFVTREGTVLFDSSADESYVGERLPAVEAGINELLERADIGDIEQGVIERLALSQLSLSKQLPDIEGHNAAVATTRGAATEPDQTLFPVTLAADRRVPAIDQVVRPVIIAAGVALVIGVALSVYHARSLSRPISRLTDAAEEINAGNLDRRVTAGGGEEIGTLVGAFNGMLDRLADTYRSQRQLLANIAHELRTPLTSIQGYATALRDGVIPDGDARDQALQAISEESERMNILVNQILQLSRLESGELPLRVEQVPLNEVFEQLERDFTPRASDSDVELTLHPADATVRGDAELLRQAVGNLIANALRHTPPGGRVTVRSEPSPDSTSVTITVSDTGEGIAPADLEHIFERFYRAAGQEPSQSEHSFGLGLAIVREVVHHHEGRVGVTSTLGEGTTFTIELPVESRDR
jgi:signal transduction histidine kinase